MIEDRLPHPARIGGLPHAASDAAHVAGRAAARHAAASGHAARAEGPDEAPTEPIEELRRHVLRARACRHAYRKQEREQQPTGTAQDGNSGCFHRCIDCEGGGANFARDRTGGVRGRHCGPWHHASGAPGVLLPGSAVGLPEEFARPLRVGHPPVLGRTEKGLLLLDLRCVPADKDDDLYAVVVRAAGTRA